MSSTWSEQMLHICLRNLSITVKGFAEDYIFYIPLTYKTEPLKLQIVAWSGTRKTY